MPIANIFRFFICENLIYLLYTITFIYTPYNQYLYIDTIVLQLDAVELVNRLKKPQSFTLITIYLLYEMRVKCNI